MGTKREKMLEREKALEDVGTLGLEMQRRGATNQVRRLMGDDGFGTSLGAGADSVGREVSRAEGRKGRSLNEMEPTVRQAMREAAQQEQREANRGKGMKAGGSVSAKGWGKARGARAAKVY